MNIRYFKYLMSERGYNIKTLASELGVFPQTLSYRIKHGFFHVEDIIAIEDAFNLPFREIFSDKEEVWNDGRIEYNGTEKGKK